MLMQFDPSELTGVIQSTYPFHLLNPEEIEKVYQHAAVYQYSAGDGIYQQGQAGSHVYILAYGRVSLNAADGQGNNRYRRVTPLNTLFGLEGIEGSERWATAVAEEDTVVICFNTRHFRKIMQDHARFLDHLTALVHAAQMEMNKQYPWKEADEVFYFVENRHPITLFLNLLVPGGIWFVCLMSGLFLWASTRISYFHAWFLMAGSTLIVLPWMFLLWVDWNNDYAIVTSRRVLYFEKIIFLYESRQEAPIHAVLSVGKSSSFFGRLFHYSDLLVRTYTGMITLASLREPEVAADIITCLQSQERSPIGRRERVSQMAAALRAQLLDGKITSLKADDSLHSNVRGSGRGRLSQLLQMRFEKDGVITYRTHWWILLKKTFVPGTILLLLQIFLLFSGGAGHLTQMIVTGVLGVTAGLWWIYELADWANDYYQITPDQIIDMYKKPLGSEDKKTAPLKNIQSINFKRNGLFGILFNFGTVFILIGDHEFTFDHVPNPSAVQQEIFRRLCMQEYRKKQEEDSSRQLLMREWIEAYNQVLLEAEQRQSDRTERGQPPFEPPESFSPWQNMDWQRMDAQKDSKEGTIPPISFPQR